MEHPNTRSPSPPVGIVQRNLGRHAALGMATAAVDEAERLGVHVNVAVVDRHCTLMAFLRMPDASLISVQTAMDKAYSAASSAASPRSTLTSRETPFSAIVTPNKRCIRLIVTALWVTIR